MAGNASNRRDLQHPMRANQDRTLPYIPELLPQLLLLWKCPGAPVPFLTAQLVPGLCLAPESGSRPFERAIKKANRGFFSVGTREHIFSGWALQRVTCYTTRVLVKRATVGAHWKGHIFYLPEYQTFLPAHADWCTHIHSSTCRPAGLL